jgi:hypothetical protein
MVALNIDLLDYHNKLHIKYQGSERLVFDSIRKRWLPFTSEEFVRQLFIEYLVLDRQYPKNWISVERGIHINGIYRRYDLAVHDKEMNPTMLIECKSPSVTISQDVFDQILHYNMEMNVPLLVVTNGASSYCCTIDQEKGKLQFLSEIPVYQ